MVVEAVTAKILDVSAIWKTEKSEDVQKQVERWVNVWEEGTHPVVLKNSKSLKERIIIAMDGPWAAEMDIGQFALNRAMMHRNAGCEELSRAYLQFVVRNHRPEKELYAQALEALKLS